MKASILYFLPLVNLSMAKCYTSGWAWNGAANEVLEQITRLCSPDGLARTFDPASITLKERCLDTSIARGLTTKAKISIEYHGTGPIGMPNKLYIDYFKREVNRCYLAAQVGETTTV